MAHRSKARRQPVAEPTTPEVKIEGPMVAKPAGKPAPVAQANTSVDSGRPAWQVIFVLSAIGLSILLLIAKAFGLL